VEWRRELRELRELSQYQGGEGLGGIVREGKLPSMLTHNSCYEKTWGVCRTREKFR